MKQKIIKKWFLRPFPIASIILYLYNFIVKSRRPVRAPNFHCSRLLSTRPRKTNRQRDLENGESAAHVEHMAPSRITGLHSRLCRGTKTTSFRWLSYTFSFFRGFRSFSQDVTKLTSFFLQQKNAAKRFSLQLTPSSRFNKKASKKNEPLNL